MKKETTAPKGTATKKVTNKVTKTTTPKLKAKTEKKVDKKTAELTLTKVVKYNYPENLQGQGAVQQTARKAWRQAVRNNITKLATAVAKAPDGTAKKIAEAKLAKYEAEVLS